MSATAELVAPRGVDLDGANVLLVRVSKERQRAFFDCLAIACPVDFNRSAGTNLFVHPVLHGAYLSGRHRRHVSEVEPQQVRGDD